MFLTSPGILSGSGMAYRQLRPSSLDRTRLPLGLAPHPLQSPPGRVEWRVSRRG